MLSAIDLLEAKNFLLDVLVEVLLNHRWLKVNCFFKGQILLARDHKNSPLNLWVQVKALEWSLTLKLRALLSLEVLDFLLPHPEVVGEHFLLNVLVVEAEPIMNAAQRVNDALTVLVGHSHVVILVVAEQTPKEIQESPEEILGEHQDIILLRVV